MVLGKLPESFQQTQNFLLRQTEQLSDSLGEMVQKAIAAAVTDWLDAHPTLAWIVTHPRLSLGIALLCLLLFWGLLRLIFRASEQVWLLLLQAPLQLLRWLWQLAVIGWQKLPLLLHRRRLGRQDPLKELCSRFEAMQQEQQGVLQRLATLQEEQATLLQNLAGIKERQEGMLEEIKRLLG